MLYPIDSSFRTFARGHVFGLLTILALALVLALPQLASPIRIPGYQGLNALEGDNEAHYFARVTAARYRGTVGNPFLADATHDFLPSELTMERIIGSVMRYAPMPFSVWNTMLRILGGVAAASALYALLLVILRKDLIASLGTAAVLVGTTVMVNYQAALSWLLGRGADFEFLHFARFMNPLMTAGIFFLFLLCIYRAIESDATDRRWMVMTGLVFGIMAYAYVYYWLFAAAMLLFLALVALARRSRAAFHWLGASIIGGAVAAPYWYGFFVRMADPVFRAAVERLGLVTSHAPQVSIVLLVYLIVWIALTLAVRREVSKRSLWIWNTSVFVSSWIVMNQQIVTGRELQSGHFQWYVIVPGCIVAILSLLHTLRIWEHRVSLVLSVSALLLIVAVGSAIQLSALDDTLQVLTKRQQAAGALHWLASSGQRAATVLADNEISNLIPVYTDNRVWYANSAIVYPISMSRVQLGHFMWWRGAGLSAETVAERLALQPEFIQTLYEPHAYRFRKTNVPDQYAADIAALVAGYRRFLDEDPSELLDAFHVRYIVAEKSAIQFEPLIKSGDRLVYDDTWYRIYDRLPERL